MNTDFICLCSLPCLWLGHAIMPTVAHCSGVYSTRRHRIVRVVAYRVVCLQLADSATWDYESQTSTGSIKPWG